MKIINRSPVTQTILGSEHDDGQTAEPVDVTFARPTGSVVADQDSKSPSDSSRTTAVLAPGSSGRSESFTSLDLKVRIGAWTRWEQIDFDNFAFELRES